MRTDQALASSWSCPTFNLEMELPTEWRAKVPIVMEQSRYIIKTADSAEEFRQVIELRSAVFIEEFAGQNGSSRIDLEARDHEADFMIIQDRDSLEVLACYRLLCSEFTKDFYSLSEFAIEPFLLTDGKKLELSRACVRPDKRSKGIFVHLLWRGLAAYAAALDIRFLFGCSSVQSLDLRDIVQIYHHLYGSQAIGNEFKVTPQNGYAFLDESRLRSLLEKTLPADAESLLPPILSGYLKAGARIYGCPAFDQDFQCIDLFTVLDFTNIAKTHERKYLGK